MEHITQTLDDIVSSLQPLTVEWKDDTAHRIIKEELGDARSFSLDSPKSRAPRLAAIRAAAAAR